MEERSTLDKKTKQFEKLFKKNETVIIQLYIWESISCPAFRFFLCLCLLSTPQTFPRRPSQHSILCDQMLLLNVPGSCYARSNRNGKGCCCSVCVRTTRIRIFIYCVFKLQTFDTFLSCFFFFCSVSQFVPRCICKFWFAWLLLPLCVSHLVVTQTFGFELQFIWHAIRDTCGSACSDLLWNTPASRMAYPYKCTQCQR